MTQEKYKVFKYCKSKGKVLPIEEARRLDAIAEYEANPKLANIKHGYIPDEMKETKHPADGKYYTSKSKFRAVTEAHGLVEVGTAEEHGYDVYKGSYADLKNRRDNEKFKERLIWNMNNRRRA